MNLITPIFASGALRFAFEKATTEGKITIGVLLLVSIFSWTVIITKSRQLYRARTMTKRFFSKYRETRDPMDIARAGEEFDGAPAYELYYSGAEETEYHLKNNPVQVAVSRRASLKPGYSSNGDLAIPARQVTTKLSSASFDSVKVALERAA